MTRCAIYSRVSSDAQKRDGTSLETQERAGQAYAERLGWQVVEAIRDTAPGWILERPGLERARHLIRSGAVDVFLCYAVDRWARQQNHIGILFDELQNASVRLECVTEQFENTAVGRFVLAARAFVAEVEREKITERTMRGKGERARSGKLPQATGKGIYGYRYDVATGRREIVPEQAAVVEEIFTAFASGTSTMAITNRLNARGLPTFTGRQWYGATVYHLLENETYTGRTIYRRTIARRVCDPKTGKKHRIVELRDESEHIEVPGATPRLVDDETFAAVQARLLDPERRQRGNRTHDYSLSGWAKCLRCGRAIVGQTLSKTFRYYRCRRSFAGPQSDRCDARYIRADDLEEAVRNEVARVLAQPALIAAEYACQREGSDIETAAAERDLRRLDDQKRRLVQLFKLGELELDEYQVEARQLKVQRSVLEGRLRQVERVRGAPSLEKLQAACDGVRRWIAEAQGPDLELLLEALQIRLKVEPGRAELTGVIPHPDYASPCSHADVRTMVINRSLYEGFRSS